MSFAREGEDVLMTVRYELPPALRGQASNPMVAMVLRPMVLRLDRSGAIYRMEDEESYWTMTRQAFGELLRTQGPVDPAAERLALEAMERMRSLPETERLSLLTRNVGPVVGLAGANLPRGSVRGEPELAQTPFGAVHMTPTVALERVENGIAFVSVLSSVSGEDLRAMAGNILDSAREAGVRPRRPLTVPDDLEFTVRETAEVAVETGLTRRYEIVRSGRYRENGELKTSASTMRLELVR